MSDSPLQALKCPTCGAPLTYDGVSPTIRCSFCQSTIAVPDELRDDKAAKKAPLSPEQKAAIEEIRRLARSGQKIEAIRRFREVYPVGLKDAKLAVDALAEGKDIPLPPPAPPSPHPADDTLAEIEKLLRASDKIAAIRVYRGAYNVSLQEAKDAVDQIEARLAATASGTKFADQPVINIQVTSLQADKQAKAATVAASAVGFSSCFGIGLTLFILLVVAVPVGLLLLQPGGPFKPRLTVIQPARLIPSGQDTPPDVLTLVYNVNASARAFARVSSVGKLLWTTQPLDGDGYAEGLTVSGSLFYTTNQFDLLAYNLADGSLAWQTRLPNQLTYGDETLIAAGGRIIALTADRSLQAYDAQTGQPAWNRPLKGYDRRIRQVGSQLLILDYTETPSEYSLLFINPADGSVQQTLQPICTDSTLSPNYDAIGPEDGIVYDTNNQSLYLIFGDWGPGCIQRYAWPSGEQLWNTLVEESFSFTSDFTYLLNGEQLFFTFDDKVMMVNSAGEAQLLLEEADNAFVPLGVFGDQLILRAEKKRGAQRFELWGMNIATRQITWRHGFEAGKPIDPPKAMGGLIDNDEFGWSYHLSPQGLQLLQFQAKPHQVTIETLDPASGNSLGPTVVPLKFIGSDFYSIPSIIGWQGQTVWVAVEAKVVAIDTASGKILFTWQ